MTEDGYEVFWCSTLSVVVILSTPATANRFGARLAPLLNVVQYIFGDQSWLVTVLRRGVFHSVRHIDSVR